MDQSSDKTAARFHRIAALYGAPEYVKRATAEELAGTDGLPGFAFADPARRLYPMHTKAATWASLSYLLEDTRGDGDRAAPLARLTEAGAAHGIGRDLDALRAAVAAGRKQAAVADDDHAVRFDTADGPVRKLPVRNAAEVKAAAAYLRRYRPEIPFGVAARAAHVVLAKQASLGVALDPPAREGLERMCGQGTGTKAAAVTLLAARVAASRLGGGPLTAAQDGMRKLAAAVAAMDPRQLDRNFRLKLAGLVDEFDRAHELVGHLRAGRLPAPEAVLFEHTLSKLAGVLEGHVEDAAGRVWAKADLGRVPLGEVREFLGAEKAAASTRDGVHADAGRLAETVAGLDAKEAGAFGRLMAELAIAPAHQAAGAITLDRDLVRSLYVA